VLCLEFEDLGGIVRTGAWVWTRASGKGGGQGALVVILLALDSKLGHFPL
jgi:hypothetical protein